MSISANDSSKKVMKLTEKQIFENDYERLKNKFNFGNINLSKNINSFPLRLSSPNYQIINTRINTAKNNTNKSNYTSEASKHYSNKVLKNFKDESYNYKSKDKKITPIKKEFIPKKNKKLTNHSSTDFNKNTDNSIYNIKKNGNKVEDQTKKQNLIIAEKKINEKNKILNNDKYKLISKNKNIKDRNFTYNDPHISQKKEEVKKNYTAKKENTSKNNLSGFSSPPIDETERKTNRKINSITTDNDVAIANALDNMSESNESSINDLLQPLSMNRKSVSSQIVPSEENVESKNFKKKFRKKNNLQ